MSEKIIFILLGWSLGLLSPIVLDWNKSKKDKAVFKDTFKNELDEIKYRFAIGVMDLKMHLGELDQELLKWLYPIVVNYKGSRPQENSIKFINDSLALSEDQLKRNVKKYARNQFEKGLNLRKHYISVLETNFPMHYFDVKTQNYLLDIRMRMRWMNEEVENSSYYFQLTFNEEITGINRKIVENNLKDSYHSYAIDTKLIVDSISKIVIK